MIPAVDRGTHRPDESYSQTWSSANASLRGPGPTPSPLPPGKLHSIAQPLVRPSTAPPASQFPSQIQNKTRTAVVTDLRARNLLFQKAISHLDNAILHLLAARCGIPSGRLEKVRGGARTRAELLERLDRAIARAREGTWVEEEEWSDGPENIKSEGRTGTDGQSSSRSSLHPVTSDAPNPERTCPNHPPTNVVQAQSQTSDAHLLCQATSQSQVTQQAPQRTCTLAELLQRRKALQDSLASWQDAAAQLRAAHPHLQSQTVVASETSLSAKYQQILIEIKRREEYMAYLNQTINQAFSQEHAAALASYTPPPLDRPRFDAAYAQFCQGKSIEVNRSIVIPDVARPVLDLHQLHVAVMLEGSFVRVQCRKSWDVVGARLGYVQTTATVSEPAKSSPEIAVHLERAYRDRLQNFDYLYVSSVVENFKKRMEEQKRNALGSEGARNPS